jgi:hypothetical protein
MPFNPKILKSTTEGFNKPSLFRLQVDMSWKWLQFEFTVDKLMWGVAPKKK